MRAPVVLLGLCVGALVACGGRRPGAAQYVLTGQILALRPETRAVVVKHDDIPGFMPAMTMTYQVKDAALLAGRAPGDLITATLIVDPGGTAWLAAITRTGSAPLPEGALTRIPAAAGVAPLGPGEAVPDTPLTDQDGRTVSLADWRGSAVAVTFVYLRCPLRSSVR